MYPDLLDIKEYFTWERVYGARAYSADQDNFGLYNEEKYPQWSRGWCLVLAKWFKWEITLKAKKMFYAPQIIFQF